MGLTAAALAAIVVVAVGVVAGISTVDVAVIVSVDFFGGVGRYLPGGASG